VLTTLFFRQVITFFRISDFGFRISDFWFRGRLETGLRAASAFGYDPRHERTEALPQRSD
jgi:hypothetical protein